MTSRRRLLALHEPRALADIEAVAAELRMERSNVRLLWLDGALTDEQAAEALKRINEKETAE